MGRENMRISWNKGHPDKGIEPLDAYQRRMEETSLRKRSMAPYELARFEQGWMYIEWTRFKPFWNSNFQPRTPLGKKVYSALEQGERMFNFDAEERIWTPDALVKGVREITLQLNQNMTNFLHRFRGDKVLLDRRAEIAYGDKKGEWGYEQGDVSWFLKRPNY